MNPVIDLLQTKQLIWQGSQQRVINNTTSSGYTEFDEQLNGGFPEHGVIEINSSLGIGELLLLTPYIKKHSQNRLSIFINPPGHLSSDYFIQQKINLNQIIILFPKNQNEALWAAEQCLKSGCCGSVTLWHPSLAIHQAKRLQVASETGQCLHFVFKTKHKHQINLPVSLNLVLRAEENKLKVTINKRKGGWLKRSFSINIHQYWPHFHVCRETNSVVPFPIRKKGNL